MTRRATIDDDLSTGRFISKAASMRRRNGTMLDDYGHKVLVRLIIK